MYERFTDRAREIVRQASALAIEGQQERISADHLFLSLLASDGTARLILSAIGADVEGLSSSIAKIVRKHPESITPAKSVIEAAMEQAASCGQNFIGSEHLLLGLLALPIERQADSNRLLRSAGITLDAARQELARIVGIAV
jgi:ATP-dependent Clp protease ATP-binding subunit ClpC